jgi:hypothetical protein
LLNEHELAGGAIAGVGAAAGGEMVEARIPWGYAVGTAASTGALGDLVGQVASGQRIDGYELLAAAANAVSLGFGGMLVEPITPYARSILARGGVKALVDKAVLVGQPIRARGVRIFVPLSWGVAAANEKPKPCP